MKVQMELVHNVELVDIHDLITILAHHVQMHHEIIVQEIITIRPMVIDQILVLIHIQRNVE